jgi:hypothetical protein
MAHGIERKWEFSIAPHAPVLLGFATNEVPDTPSEAPCHIARSAGR